MSKLKQLAGQTALYGISTILVRSLNWLISPFHTYVFGSRQSELGIIIEMYSYVAFINVILMYGMETAFFRYASDNKENQNKVFSTSLLSLGLSTSFFLILILLFSQNIANALQYPNLQSIVIMLAFILAFDTMSNIPFAKLRLEAKPLSYIKIKLFNVIITVGLNFFLLFPLLKNQNDMFGFHLKEEDAIFYVFLANLVASAATFAIFVPDFFRSKFEFCKKTWKDLMRFGLPLVIVGLAGIVNETIDRILLKYLLPQETLADRNAQVAIYGSVYKLAIFMSLVVQAYKMGAEPFFFKQAKDED
ncbi:MAG: oligosaccharide flippase family protein, partial [Bacteroidetes bacterium]|nr:oligosaccharide flippase family protein [Bacteroidota bacterium]